MESTLQANEATTLEATTTVGSTPGRHYKEDRATLSTSQLRVRQRIETRRLVRLLVPGGVDNHRSES